MSAFFYGCLTLAALGGLAALLAHVRERRLLNRLSAMLDEAVSGTFTIRKYDETQLSAVEARMSRYLDQCETSSRNLAGQQRKLQSLLSDISHQTRTPLSNILLYTQLLAEQDLGADAAPCLEALAAQAEKLQFLIDALVKTSRMEAGVVSVTPVPGPLGELLAEVEAQTAPLCAGAGICLTVDRPDLTAVFDRKWTAEALVNLVDNAVKYSPAGSRITVSARGYELFCRVDVADEGMGIPEAEQPKVFSRFYRSPAVADRPGVGVGLYLAREIVTRQGGYLKLASAPGRGSVFSVFLPREK